MKKWIFTLFLWYIFVDNTPWIQDPEKKTVWILKPGWSTLWDCLEIKSIVFELLDGENKRYMCIDMNLGGDVMPLGTINLEDLAEHILQDHRIIKGHDRK